MNLLRFSQTALLSFFLFESAFNNTAKAMQNGDDEDSTRQSIPSRAATSFHQEDTEQLMQTVSNTPVENLSDLIQKFSPNKEETLQHLRHAYPAFRPSDYPEKHQGDLKKAATQFENSVKALNIRYALGDPDAAEEYTRMYDHLQEILCEEHVDANKTLQAFHLENFSLLSPESRKTIAQSYREGREPFEKSEEKAESFSQSLHLPLTPDIFSKN